MTLINIIQDSLSYISDNRNLLLKIFCGIIVLILSILYIVVCLTNPTLFTTITTVIITLVSIGIFIYLMYAFNNVRKENPEYIGSFFETISNFFGQYNKIIKLSFVLMVIFIFVMIATYGKMNNLKSGWILIFVFLFSILSLGLFFSFSELFNSTVLNFKSLVLIIFICVMIQLFTHYSNSNSVLKKHAHFMFPLILIFGVAIFFLNIYTGISYNELTTKYFYQTGRYLEGKKINASIIYISLCIFLFLLFSSNMTNYAMDYYKKNYGFSLKIDYSIIIIYTSLFLVFGFLYLLSLLFDSELSSLNNNIKNIFLYVTFIVLFILSITWFISIFSKTNLGFFNFMTNFIVFMMVLSLIFKIIISTDLYKKNPYVKLMVHSIFYIPCLFSGIFESIYNVIYKIFAFFYYLITTGFNFTKAMKMSFPSFGSSSGAQKPGVTSREPTDNTGYTWTLVGIVLLYFVYYIVYPYVKNKSEIQNGKLLVNNPIQLNKQTILASYQTLNGSEKLDYKYGISFWVYLNSESPSVNASSDKFTSILRFGNVFNVQYNVILNKLRVVMKDNKAPDNILDENGDVILYEQSDILLQKWNNIYIKYDGGTLDIFYNTELVKSVIEVVPNMEYDNLIAGTDYGIYGQICNINYFKEPLSYEKLYYMYYLVKDKNPPIVSNLNKTVLEISEYTIKPLSSFDTSTSEQTDYDAPIDDMSNEEQTNPNLTSRNKPDYLSLKWYFSATDDNQNV